MAESLPSLAEEEGESSVEVTVDSPQTDREAENTEQEQAPEASVEEQVSISLLCAALESNRQCTWPAVIPCRICQLVAYCTKDCMKKDAERHSLDCPPPTEPPSRSQPTSEIPDDPVQDRGVFWANYAATDVLNLAANEGAEYKGLLRVLLTGTFGLRHLIYSVVAMPETASPMLSVTISEMELPHLYRTLLSLLILRKGMEINMDPYEVAELVTHVWYSYKWPSQVGDFIKNHLAADFIPFTQGKNFMSTLSGLDPWCHHTYQSDLLILIVGFSLPYWKAIATYLRESIDQQYKPRDRGNDVKAYGEPLDNAFARMSPSRVAGLVKWRQNGLMLPYGDPALPQVQYLNPMFFCDEPKHGRPDGFTLEPLSEWPMDEILDYTPYAAEADVYGKMAAYVREMLVKFQLRLKKKGIVIKLANAGTVKMMGHFRNCFGAQQKFDRIEAGHLFDICPSLCLLSFCHLLRHHEENPFATLLIMTQESFTKSVTPRVKELKAAEKKKLFQPVSQSLDSIAPPVQTTDNKYSAACVHRHFALQVFDREWDVFSDRYLADENIFYFKGLGVTPDLKQSVFQKGWLGLQFKKKNTVKPRWQNRLMPRNRKMLTEEDASNLKRWMSWSTTKPERWLEWKKVEDVSWATWSLYCAFVPFPGWRDYTLKELESMYGFRRKEDDFLIIEEEYENCDCGSGKRRNRCEHEHLQEPATPTEQEPAVPSEEDDSWMKMDSAEDSAAGGATEKSKQKKKKKKKQKKKAGKK